MKRLFLLLLIFIGLGSIWWQAAKQSGPQIPEQTQSLEWFGEGVTLTTMTPEGTPNQIIFAQTLRHYKPDNITDLTQVQLDILPAKAGDRLWQLSSDKGRLFHGEHTQDITRIDLWHNVLLEHPQTPTQTAVTINTSTLAIFPETEYAHTDQYTTIDQVGQHMSGYGMEIFFADQTFHLIDNVSSAHETVQ